jgi:pyroglutamyl-peptidase
MRSILVVGFGPFLDVGDNPAARLARAVDGRTSDGFRVVGREMPVSYRRAPELTAAWAREAGAAAVLGVGVARGRAVPMVERRARGECDGVPDVDGELVALAGDRVSPVADELARALGVAVSDDAGRYVCNAWLHRVLDLLPDRPVAFLHVTHDGFDPARLCAALPSLSP